MKKSVGLLTFDPFADPEDMTVGVADVHFADVPRFVGRRHCDLDIFFNTVLVNSVDVFDPDRHPTSFVVVVGGKCFSVRAFAASALSALAEKDLDITRTNG